MTNPPVLNPLVRYRLG